MEKLTRKKTLREVVDGLAALIVRATEASHGAAVVHAEVNPELNGCSGAGIEPWGLALDHRGVLDSLVAMIAERTGYPPEMLTPDLNLEARSEERRVGKEGRSRWLPNH